MIGLLDQERYGLFYESLEVGQVAPPHAGVLVGKPYDVTDLNLTHIEGAPGTPMLFGVGFGAGSPHVGANGEYLGAVALLDGALRQGNPAFMTVPEVRGKRMAGHALAHVETMPPKGERPDGTVTE
ncbi:MAG TPA: hypothetical protein VMX74_11525, partial [Pirellulales bacterium]|nr:hypothetical protein [Pirellulales bacterium]